MRKVHAETVDVRSESESIGSNVEVELAERLCPREVHLAPHPRSFGCRIFVVRHAEKRVRGAHRLLVEELVLGHEESVFARVLVDVVKVVHQLGRVPDGLRVAARTRRGDGDAVVRLGVETGGGQPRTLVRRLRIVRVAASQEGGHRGDVPERRHRDHTRRHLASRARRHPEVSRGQPLGIRKRCEPRRRPRRKRFQASFSSADPTVGLVMTRSPPSDVARRDRAPLAAMGFFSFTRSKSSASAAAKKASSPQDSWLHEAVIRFLQVRATFRAFSRHHVRSDTQRRDGTLSSNGRTTRLASRPLPDFRRVLLLAQGPMYTHPLMSFIDHHCAVFDDEDENKLEYTSIHAEFKRLVETLLSEFLVEVGVPPARFVQVVADSAGGELNDFVLGSILTVDDFVQFKAMMVRRNVQLTEEVLELHRARADAQAAAAAAAADASSSPAPSTPDPATEHPPTSPLDRSVDDDGFHRGALAQAEASSAASAADLDALATNLERDARRAAEISAREAALARAVPEFEDDTTAPEPDDGFDEGALEQAMKLSEAQFEADAIAKRDRATRRAEEASAAATKAAATAEAARAMADAAAATERAVLAQARADPNYDAGL